VQFFETLPKSLKDEKKKKKKKKEETLKKF